MSERERWIVYPLLFFALGAAVRDKLLHRVEAKEIYCESLKIVDQQDPLGRPLAELGIQRARPNDPTQSADQVGMFRLIDSEGQEVCKVASDAVFQRMFGRQLMIIDEDYRPKVIAGIEQAAGFTPRGEQTVTSQGVIYLNNQNIHRLAPPRNKPAPPKLPPDTL